MKFFFLKFNLPIEWRMNVSVAVRHSDDETSAGAESMLMRFTAVIMF